MKSVQIDRSRPLREQPATGHNRFHPDIPPIVTVAEGEEVALETRDGVTVRCRERFRRRHESVPVRIGLDDGHHACGGCGRTSMSPTSTS